MSERKFTIQFDAQLNIDQMKNALNQIQSSFSNLKMPNNIGKNVQKTIDDLQVSLRNFEAMASKGITSKTDFNKLESESNKIVTSFERLKIQLKDINKLSGTDVEKLFPSTIAQNIKDARQEILNYSEALEKTKTSITDQTKTIENLKAQLAEVQNTPIWGGTQTKELNNVNKEINSIGQQLDELKRKRDELKNKNGEPLIQPEKSSRWREMTKEITELESKLAQLQQREQELKTQRENSTTYAQQAKDVKKLNASIAAASEELKQLQQQEQQLNTTNLNELLQLIGKLTGLDISQFPQSIEGATQALAMFKQQAEQAANGGVQDLNTKTQEAQGAVNGLTGAVDSAGQATAQMDATFNDVKSLKSRIQYFFGLNNVINLFKRGIRSAIQTITELDKAMTETAVVTDFTVADMWAQLPDYTKRANELGVTTKAVYEASTLYYQQGLKTNEVMAMANETMKMARIAGLEAADATDRMTNAIRGFNMEINETNAQRIDDVYSRLAAISASNVDEISTAMTKVASLAHNANMEFETTAAFLAQIIETTREAPETAGTALKTVIARFAEVKKMVSEGMLTGADEEGEIIDVNKISAALHTIGIDLNQFFLGEVGLDDIFMEIAEKWESLTTLQQRYIATQAAGS